MNADVRKLKNVGFLQAVSASGICREWKARRTWEDFHAENEMVAFLEMLLTLLAWKWILRGLRRDGARHS